LSYSDLIVQELAHKVGDNLLKVRNSAEEALAAVAAHPQFGIKLCLHHLVSDAPPPTRAKPKGGKKPVLTSK
jgi:centrosomal protein CEP104